MSKRIVVGAIVVGALMIGVSASRVHLRFEGTDRNTYGVGLGMTPAETREAFRPPTSAELWDPLSADRLAYVSSASTGLQRAEFRFRSGRTTMIRLFYSPDTDGPTALREAGIPADHPDGVFQHRDGHAQVFIEDQGLSIVYARSEEFLNVPKSGVGFEKTSPRG